MRSLMSIGLFVSLVAMPATAADLNGDTFFLTTGRPPGFLGPQPVEFGNGEEYILGLDAFFQLLFTTDPNDPLLAVRLMAIRTEPGLVRDHALVIDFSGVIDNLPPQYPFDLIGNTTLWFDDLESVTVNSENPPSRIGRLVALRSAGPDGNLEWGNPLRFPDGTGVTPPARVDDVFEQGFNGFGEGLVFTLVDWTTVEKTPVFRIEFDLVPSLAADVDRDGDVDLSDFVRVQSLFTGAGTGSGPKQSEADFDADGDVDLADVLTLLESITGPVGN